jgi:hypothetical protein
MGGMSKAEKEQTQAGLAQVGAWGAIISEVTALGFALMASVAAGFQLVMMKRLEATMSGKSAGADLAEAGASALTTGADIGEAGGSALTTGADIAEAGGSAVAGTADAAEAAGSAASAAADAAEAALSLLVAKAKVIEMGASLFAAKGDIAEAGGSGLATTADLAEATGTASVTAALTALLAILGTLIAGLTAAAAGAGVSGAADVGEAAGSQLALTTDVGEAFGSQLALNTDIAEAGGSLQATITDMAEASASALTTIADTAEAAGSGLALTTDVAEAGGSALTTAADIGEAVGSTVAGVADTAEAGASFLAAGALGALTGVTIPLTVAMIALGIAVAAIVVAFVAGLLMSVYKTAVAVKKLEQSIEKFNSAASRELDELKEKGGGSKEDFVAANVGAATADFQRQIVEATAMTRHFETGMKSVMPALAGAAAGFLLFGPVGMAIGGLIGASIGLWDAFTGADKAIQETIAMHATNQAKVASASAKMASTTWDNVKALGDFESSLKAAADANLTAADTLEIMSSGATSMVTQLNASEANMASVGRELDVVRKSLQGQGLISGDEVVEQATDEERTKAQQQDIAAFKELNKQRENLQKTHNDLLKKTLGTEGKLRNQLAKGFGELVKDLASGEGGHVSELSDIGSFDDLLRSDPAMRKQWAKAGKAVSDIIDKEFEAALEAAELMETRATRVGDTQGAEKAQELQVAIEGQAAARKKQFELSAKKAAVDRILAEQKARASVLRTAIIQALQARAIQDVNTSLKGLNNALLGATNTARNFAQIGDAISLANLEGPKAATISTAAFDVDLRQIDSDILNVALQQGVDAMTAGIGINAPIGDKVDQEIKDRAQRMRDSITLVKDVMDNIQVAWGNAAQEGIPKAEGARRELVDTLFHKLNHVVGHGLTLPSGIPNEMGNIIREKLKEQIAKGDPIDTDFMEEIIEGLDAGPAKEAMKKWVETQNTFITKMDEVNNAIIQVQNRTAEAFAQVVDVVERNADRMANIRGGGRGGRHRFEKETGRRTAAQARLGTTASGAGAIAGDVRATANALKTLTDEAKASTDAAKAAGDPKLKVALNKAANDQINAAKKASQELERLADQSARAADIEAEIAKEREKRGQVTSVLEEFAFAGREQQADMTGQMRDVLTAASQGSMAGATDEQRAGIGSMLDKLADVEIGDTGKTGRELKAELTEKQLISQGVDPRLARQVGEEAAKGSKEEQLLGELEALGQEEVRAAQALAENAITQVDYLQVIAENTSRDFDRDINAGARKATTDDKGKREAVDLAKLAEEYGKLQLSIGKLATQQESLATQVSNASAEVGRFTTLVGQISEAIKNLDPNRMHDVPTTEQRPSTMLPPVNSGEGTGGGWASGGLIYRAGGGSIFQPRGTDTVPAMLSPGEFVVRKSAVDKIGAENLAALNQGKGGAVYRQQGGMVGLPTPGAINSAFYSLIKGGKRTEIMDALTKSGWKDPRRIYNDLRELAEAGKLDVRKIQGPQQLENALNIYRKSKWLRGVNPTEIGYPDISEIDMLNLEGGAEYKRDKNVVWGAISKIGMYHENVKTEGNAVKKAMNASGDANSRRGMVFAGHLIKNAGLTQKNLAMGIGMIARDFGQRQDETKKRFDRFKQLFSASGATETVGGGEAETAEKTVPTFEAGGDWNLLIKQLGEFSGVAVAQNLGDEAKLKEKQRGAVTAALGDDLGKVYLRLIDQGVLRMAKGGSIADTIPAMLTPGEFVMSPEAVQKHGVGFMRDLNRGHAPGFRRGGLIGRGNVAYRRRGSNNAEGGGTTLMVDPSSLQAVLSEFNAQFVGYLDMMISEFALNTGALTGLTNAIQGGMVMTHNFSGALEFNVKIGNKKNIEEAVAKGLEGTLQTMIETEVDKKITKMKDEP